MKVQVKNRASVVYAILTIFSDNMRYHASPLITGVGSIISFVDIISPSTYIENKILSISKARIPSQNKKRPGHFSMISGGIEVVWWYIYKMAAHWCSFSHHHSC